MKVAATAWRLLFHPSEAWNAIADRDAGAWDTLARYVAPLALLPAAGWGLRAQELGPAARLESFAMTFVLVIGTVLSVALAVHLLAPAYGVARHWSRAVAVAGFGSTPVMACGPLFASPLLAAVGVIAMLHVFYLYSIGLQRAMRCRSGDAAEFTAISFLLSMVLCGAAGMAGSALGWL